MTQIFAEPPLTSSTEHTFESCHSERKSLHRHPNPCSTYMARTPTRLDERKRCWRLLPGPLFMKLCIECAYPSTQVLKGLWRTCG